MLKSIGNGAELFHELIESNCYPIFADYLTQNEESRIS